MSKRSLPDMSVILPLPGDFRILRAPLKHLSDQDIAERLEMVLVCWNRKVIHFNAKGLEAFHSHKLIQMEGAPTRGEVYAAGVNAASAPVVALTENHALTQPGWAQALLKAHEKPWAAVGPAIINGQPNHPVDMACGLTLYGPWLIRSRGKEMDDLPGSNSSYKKEILLKYGPDLARLMDNHTLLHWDLRKNKYRLWLEPGAVLIHHEYEDVKNLLAENYRVGHRFAANRSRSWGTLKRILYIMGSPLIPLVRLYRILAGVGGSSIERRDVVRALPLTMAALAAGAWGELKGYALSDRGIKDIQVDYELELEARILKKELNKP